MRYYWYRFDSPSRFAIHCWELYFPPWQLSIYWGEPPWSTVRHRSLWLLAALAPFAPRQGGLAAWKEHFTGVLLPLLVNVLFYYPLPPAHWCWLGNWLPELRQAVGWEIQARHPDQRQAVLAMESSSTKHLAAGCRNAGRNRWSMTATPSLWAIFGSWPTTWRSFLRWQAHREDREGLQGVFMPREWFELGKPFSHSCIPVLRPGK